MTWLKNESQCHKKKSYFTTIEAERVRERAEKKRGVALRVYKCPCCLQYHLTKKKERTKAHAR
jgi:hypothetical protein